jgi:spermidine synthase
MTAAEFREHAPGSPVDYVYTDVRVLHEERSAFQEIKVIEHPVLGRMLILDGVVQLTEHDEFLYHEMLVHPALMTHPGPVNVLIVGGGDGGSLREVLKHRTVRRVTVAEIDRRVVDVSIDFLPSLSAGFADPRTEVVFGDGAALLEDRSRRFDVVIVDSTDPVGPAERLFSDDFYRSAARSLSADGVFVTQSESLLYHAGFVAEVLGRLGNWFPIVDCYGQALAMYPGNWWAFAIATMGPRPRKPRTTGRLDTRYYTREAHRKAFLARSALRRLRAGRSPWPGASAEV